MANEAKVINITALLGARRAAREVAADPVMQAALFEALLPVPEPVVATATFTPAYCDQENETRGAKYDRRLTTAEIAARVRAEIKAATGTTIPKGTKVSVRTSTFSGGSSISLRVTAVPASLVVCNPERVVREAANPHAYIDAIQCPYFTPEAVALLDAITDICQAYNRNNSDSSVDFFDVHFYGGHAEFSWDVRDASRAAILASREVAS